MRAKEGDFPLNNGLRFAHMISSRPPRQGLSPTLRRLGFEPLERRMALAVGLMIPESASPFGGEGGDTVRMDSRPVLDGADVQQMPSIAVNPLDPKHLVMVAMDRSLVNTGYAGLRTAVSKDGGNSWQTGFVQLPEGFE